MNNIIKTESAAMRFSRGLGLGSVAWSLRRLHCPVNKEALVLEVGSGGNPYARSNVLLDAYQETRERHWAPLVADRPTVLGFVERLPFRDKAFDFVIACHVLEHSPDPERFLGELQRVARAGYIEVPDAFMERINPYRDHRLEITLRYDELVIRKKASWRPEPDTVELYEHLAKPIITGKMIPRHPFEFHVRYYWENEIRYRVLNPEVDAAWEAPPAAGRAPEGVGGEIRQGRSLLVGMIRSALSQKARNRTIDLLSLLRCPTCGSERIATRHGCMECDCCHSSYPVRNGIPLMFSAKGGEGLVDGS
jgi:SAM-dependent methyltransferase/uncharacterized protein YbaR (Trm112 family)